MHIYSYVHMEKQIRESETGLRRDEQIHTYTLGNFVVKSKGLE